MTHQKTYIVAIGSTFFALFALLCLVWTSYAIYTTGKLLTLRVESIAESVIKEKMFDDLESSLMATEVERLAVESFVLTEENTSVFLTTIEEAARILGVELVTNSLEVTKPPKKQATTTLPATPEAKDLLFDTLLVSFSIEGSETGVTKMLSIFETLPYNSQVKNFSLHREVGGRARGTIDLSVTLLK